MAQGNYVAVPGTDPNWARGLSATLADIAQSYYRRDASEKENKRLAEAADESRRRWEADRAYTQSRDILSDARQSARDKLAQEQANLAMQLSQARLDEIGRAAAAREVGLGYIKDYTPEKARQALFDSNPETQKFFADEMAKDKQDLANSLMVKHTRAQQGDMGTVFGELNKGLTEQSTGMVDAEGKAIDYSAQFDELLAKGEISPMLEEYKKGLEQLQTAQESYIQQNLPLYKGQQTALLTKALAGSGLESHIPGLTSGYSSITDLTDRAVRMQKTEQDRNDKLADMAYKSFTLSSRGGKSDYDYIKPKEVTDPEVEKAIQDLSSGPVDSITLLNNYKAAVENKVPTYIALEALKRSVSVKPRLGGLFTTRTTDYGPSDFIEFAKKLQKGNEVIGNARSKGVRLSQEDLLKEITPRVAPYRDPEEQNRLAFLGGRALLGPTRTSNDYFPRRIEGGLDNSPAPNVLGTTKGNNTSLELSDLLPPTVTPEERISAMDSRTISRSPQYERLKAALGDAVPDTAPMTEQAPSTSKNLPSLPRSKREATREENTRDELLKLIKNRDERIILNAQESGNEQRYPFQPKKPTRLGKEKVDKLNKRILSLGKSLDPEFSLEDLPPVNLKDLDKQYTTKVNAASSELRQLQDQLVQARNRGDTAIAALLERRMAPLQEIVNLDYWSALRSLLDSPK